MRILLYIGVLWVAGLSLGFGDINSLNVAYESSWDLTNDDAIDQDSDSDVALFVSSSALDASYSSFYILDSVDSQPSAVLSQSRIRAPPTFI